MQPEWITGIAGVLIAILVSVLQGLKQLRPILSAERYSELNSLLVNEEAIREQLRSGNKIRAIKLYREQTGVGLKEAKDAIDRMALELKTGRLQRRNQPEQGRVDPDELQRLILAGQKIHAIKYYRQVTGVGLKEAKDAVEWLEAQIHQNM